MKNNRDYIVYTKSTVIQSKALEEQVEEELKVKDPEPEKSTKVIKANTEKATKANKKDK